MAGKQPSNTKASEAKLVRELADILNETNLAEIEMKKGDLKIRVSKTSGTIVAAQSMAAPIASPIAGSSAATQSSPVIIDTSAVDDHSNNPGAVKSPMVGTAYIRPSPDADPFVKIGESVKEGDTIMLVEAMKTFNPITAAKSGTITRVLVEDAQPVEYGEPLFIIE